ncbi:VWA domain-containing protein [Streptomyces sp. MJP52]|uniref:VWA domain-containing protein n=1 Tax=Streptomyces sp. MJP52 TaxID=2940555 RepID=UPI0024766217|nr:VWA domain-containing protein [Streptomyces sp. MJP52]MDH6228753.1 magnesium chelatase subunit D [Streptomyces sp. MJP52]
MPLVRSHYPFSAIVGCDAGEPDDLGLSLILTGISPQIGGVLVRGEKGTAKSTAARALAALLPPVDVHPADRFSTDPADPDDASPDGPFEPGGPLESRPVRLVELPVGATEDRVLGSLHLEQALSHGKVAYEPGLLARAHRGILYADEVNLLPDHLVDLLLDAAATGRVTVERDGFSMEHAARFLLIGTMNPEEGELRPQLLDRFGLTVEVAAPRDPAPRAEVVRRRMAYDADPAAFAARHRPSEEALAARIAAARSRLGEVRLPDAALHKIAEICAAFDVDGLRADIVTARTAVAHAAWAGRTTVTRDDIRRAARLALPHRRRRNPFDAPGLDEELLDRILGDDELPPDPPDGTTPPPPADGGPDGPDAGPGEDGPDGGGPTDGPGDGTRSGGSTHGPEGAADSDSTPQPGGTPALPDGAAPGAAGDEAPDGPRRTAPAADTTVKATAPYRPRLLTVRGTGEGADGRRSRALGARGRRIGADRPGHRGARGSLHLVETVRAAAARAGAARTGSVRAAGSLRLRPEDLRTSVREGREANLILFCVDASGSMAARKRMTQVKTAVLSLLLDAYRRRDKVGLITFRGQDAELALPPTHSVDIAAARLDGLPAGGRTPLAEGLLEAARVVARERRRDPRLRPLLVVVTDGRATGGKDAVARSLAAADQVASLGVSTVVVDSESGPLRLGLAAHLAARLHADHLPVREVSADALSTAVRERAA